MCPGAWENRPNTKIRESCGVLYCDGVAGSDGGAPSAEPAGPAAGGGGGDGGAGPDGSASTGHHARHAGRQRPCVEVRKKEAHLGFECNPVRDVCFYPTQIFGMKRQKIGDSSSS